MTSKNVSYAIIAILLVAVASVISIMFAPTNLLQSSKAKFEIINPTVNIVNDVTLLNEGIQYNGTIINSGDKNMHNVVVNCLTTGEASGWGWTNMGSDIINLIPAHSNAQFSNTIITDSPKNTPLNLVGLGVDNCNITCDEC